MYRQTCRKETDRQTGQKQKYIPDISKWGHLNRCNVYSKASDDFEVQRSKFQYKLSFYWKYQSTALLI